MDQQLWPATITHQEQVVVRSLFEGDGAQLLLVEEDKEVSRFADLNRLGVPHQGQVPELDDVPLIAVVRVALSLQHQVVLLH